MTERRERLTTRRVRELLGEKAEYEAPCAPGEIYPCTILEVVNSTLIKVRFDSEPDTWYCVAPGSLYVRVFTKLPKNDTIDWNTEQTG